MQATQVYKGLSGIDAPITHFSSAPCCGIGGGLVRVTLTAFVERLDAEGRAVTHEVIVGHLSCTREAAMALRDTLDKALLLGAPSAGGAN